MPPAKVGVDSRAAQLIGLPREFMVPETHPTYEIPSTESKTGGSKTKQNKTKQNKTRTKRGKGKRTMKYDEVRVIK